MKQSNKNTMMQLRTAMDNLSVKLFEVDHNRMSPQYEGRDMTYKYYKSYYIESGSADIFIQNQVYTVVPGDLVLAPADTYIYYCKGSVKDLVRYWCSFSLIYPNNLMKFRPDMIKTQCKREDIVPIFESMIQHFGRDSITDVLACKVAVMQLLIALFQGKDRESIVTEEDNNFYHTINSYINDHIKEKIAVKDLADLVHFEHSYFTRVFRKYFFESPNRYINELKLDCCAKVLTMNPDKKIEEVALEYGFSDYRYFSRIFKQHYGISPQAFQKRDSYINDKSTLL